MGSRAGNRGTHGDSLCMLNELSLSNKNPTAEAGGSVKPISAPVQGGGGNLCKTHKTAAH